MNAINIKATEINSTATENIINFPYKQDAKEIKVMSFTNTPNVAIRNRKAKAYIRSNRIRKQKRDDFWSVVIGTIILTPWVLLLFL